MSCTLKLRIATPKDWQWSFTMTIRDCLKDREFLGKNDLGYLEGLRDAASSKKDSEALQEIIDAICNGHEIEMNLVC